MNFYDKELNNLIRDAEKDGYKFSGNKFIKNQEGFCYVMEVFLQSHTTYEESGHYYIYKHTFQISEEDFKLISKYSKDNDRRVIPFEGDKEFEYLYDKIIIKYLDNDQDCDLCYFGDGNVYVCNDIYYKYGNEQNVTDLYFQYKDNDGESTFPTGFISFYEMSVVDYQEAEDVNIWLNKFMRDN